MPAEHFDQACRSGLPEKARSQSVHHAAAALILDRNLRTRGKTTDDSIPQVKSGENSNYRTLFERQHGKRVFTLPVRFKKIRRSVIGARTINSGKKILPPLLSSAIREAMQYEKPDSLPVLRGALGVCGGHTRIAARMSPLLRKHRQ